MNTWGSACRRKISKNYSERSPLDRQAQWKQDATHVSQDFPDHWRDIFSGWRVAIPGIPVEPAAWPATGRFHDPRQGVYLHLPPGNLHLAIHPAEHHPDIDFSFYWAEVKVSCTCALQISITTCRRTLSRKLRWISEIIHVYWFLTGRPDR
jgi:hypothetical protein